MSENDFKCNKTFFLKLFLKPPETFFLHILFDVILYILIYAKRIKASNARIQISVFFKVKSEKQLIFMNSCVICLQTLTTYEKVVLIRLYFLSVRIT